MNNQNEGKTMSAKHTRGPWFVDEKAYNCKQKIRQVGPLPRDKEHGIFMPVCRIAGDPRSSIENDANARLIAAAPDLLEACKNFVAAVEGLELVQCNVGPTGCRAINIRDMQAAIAKAEGRT